MSKIYRHFRPAKIYSTLHDVPYALDTLEKLQRCTVIRVVNKRELRPMVLELDVIVELPSKIRTAWALVGGAKKHKPSLSLRATAYAVNILQYNSVIGITRAQQPARFGFFKRLTTLRPNNLDDIPF